MYDLNLRVLRYFCAVYEARSFTKAAKALQMAQPPLSQAIAGLERELGTSLLHRTTRQITPTVAGERLYQEAQVLLQRAADLPRLVRSAESKQRPPLRIGAVSSTFIQLLPQLLPHFSAHEIVITDLSTQAQETALRAGEIDLAILRAWDDPGEEQTLLINERLMLALPTDHPLAGENSVHLAQLRETPLVLFDRSQSPMAFDAISGIFAEAGVSPEPVARVHNEQAMLGLVAAGMGFTIVTELLTVTPWPGVRFLNLRGAPGSSPLQARVAAGDPLGLLPHIRSVRHEVLSSMAITSPPDT